MKILLNNTPRDITPNTTLRQLLTNENLPQQNIAIAVNNRIVLRDAWDSTLLAENDKVVIIAATYGG